MFRLTVCGLAVLFNVSSVICGIVSLGPLEVKTISSVECRANVDIKLEFIRENNNKRLTIAECKTAHETCYLMHQSFGMYYSVSYTGNGTLFNVVNDIEETRGTYYCCQTYSPVDCVQLKINSPLSNATKNITDENNDGLANVLPEKSSATTTMIIIIILLIAIICALVTYILDLKKVCSLSSGRQWCSRVRSIMQNCFGTRDQEHTSEEAGSDMAPRNEAQSLLANEGDAKKLAEKKEMDIQGDVCTPSLDQVTGQSTSTTRQESSESDYEYIVSNFDITGLKTTPKKLEDEDWFHGVLPRDEVNRLIAKDGDFLVRKSKDKKTKQEQYVLSTYWKEHKHFVIQRMQNGWTFGEDVFSTIPELVNHLVASKKPFTNQSGAILSNPIRREPWELKNDDIELGTKIGHGNFGEVSIGVYRRTVAVKKCKDTLSEDQQKTFLMEGLKLKQYDHPNIVEFIGIAAQQEPVMIIMEYVSGGALLNYLQKDGKNQTRIQAANMCLDAANGMAYLSQKGCIHGALAARKCLVGDNHVVKISAFRMPIEEEIPIKWTAPEAFKSRKYTTMCDVWSYGILMWEIFSNGSQPYEGWTNAIAREKIVKGYRMHVPPNTPASIYQLMLKCWNEDPNNRITFQEICMTLKNLMDNPPSGEYWS